MRPHNFKKIFLVGLPGSGKSTWGKQLAAATGLPFVDLDTEIEAATGQPVTAVFSRHGEPYFRQVESDLLVSWATRNTEFVMATGGGAPCFHDGMKVINQHGFSIFLDVSVDVILARLANESHRPLLEGTDRKARLLKLLKQRRPVYTQAHLTLTEKDKLDDVVNRIFPVKR